MFRSHTLLSAFESFFTILLLNNHLPWKKRTYLETFSAASLR